MANEFRGIPYIIKDSAQKPQAFQGPPTALRLHAKEIIVTKADEALANFEKMLREAHEKNDSVMIALWTRRIEERKKLLARLK